MNRITGTLVVFFVTFLCARTTLCSEEETPSNLQRALEREQSRQHQLLEDRGPESPEASLQQLQAQPPASAIPPTTRESINHQQQDSIDALEQAGLFANFELLRKRWKPGQGPREQQHDQQ